MEFVLCFVRCGGWGGGVKGCCWVADLDGVGAVVVAGQRRVGWWRLCHGVERCGFRYLVRPIVARDAAVRLHFYEYEGGGGVLFCPFSKFLSRPPKLVVSVSVWRAAVPRHFVSAALTIREDVDGGGGGDSSRSRIEKISTSPVSSALKEWLIAATLAHDWRFP